MPEKVTILMSRGVGIVMIVRELFFEQPYLELTERECRMNVKLLLIISLVLVLATAVAAAQSAPESKYDFISILSADSVIAKQSGIKKLSPSEKAKLNEMFNFAYSLGYAACKANIDRSGPLGEPQKGYGVSSGNDIAYMSVVESDDGDIIKLDDGAIVEITSGYLGYLGYSNTAVLYRINGQWNIWIKGSNSHRCDVIRHPTDAFEHEYSVEEAYITEVKGSGEILMLSDGRILEVSYLDTIDTQLWLGLSDILILDGCKVLNLDESDGPVDVTFIK